MFNNKIYLDHAATTKVDRRVLEAMKPYFSEQFHNAGGLYSAGVSARRAIEESRAQISKILGSRPQEIIFTQGATEANNLAVLGIVKNWFKDSCSIKPHIITSAIEHPSVLEVCKYLEENQIADVDYLEVDEEGIVSTKDVKKLLRKETILVSVMYANNEIGTIQPISEIAKAVRHWRKENNSEYPYVHTDAVQAVNYLDINVERLGVDMMTINASKIYGPKMIGVLYKKNNVSLTPIIYGGGQEFGLRPGTENVSACVGLAKALEITRELVEKEETRLKELQDFFFTEIQKQIPGSYINGSREYRLPNNVNIGIPNMSGEEIVLRLDAKGIMASTQSACKRDNSQQSHVIKALYKGGRSQDAVLRFTMGRETKKKDLQKVVLILGEIYRRYR